MSYPLKGTAMNLFDLEMAVRTGQYPERETWKDHIKAAIKDLRNSDRSPFEQQVYDALRIFAERQSI